ncbi:hypothetical protein SRHO_G00209970 [Serrasalmus rhombeus]
MCRPLRCLRKSRVITLLHPLMEFQPEAPTREQLLRVADLLRGFLFAQMDSMDRNHMEPHAASRKRCWRPMTCVMSGGTFMYTLNVTRDLTRSLKALETEIVALQGLAEATGNRGHTEALKSKKTALADLQGITAQGVLLCCLFQCVSEMDAPSKFFFGFERRNGQKRFMHAVRTESGDLLSEPSEIRQQTVSFFSKLYKSEWAEAQKVEEGFFRDHSQLTQESAGCVSVSGRAA